MAIYTLLKNLPKYGIKFYNCWFLHFRKCCLYCGLCHKKITGDLAATHYGKCTPEFGVMSRKPGIAREWYNQYKSQTWGNNSVIIRGHEVAPPQYYKKQLKEEDPILFLEKKLDGIQKHRALEELAIEEKYLKLKQDYFKKHKI